MTMRMLSVPLLLCAVMVWTTAAAAPTAGEHAVVKRCAKCPNEWNEHCYIFEEAKVAWADAEKTCLSQGGNLASIQSKKEHKFIQDLIRSKTGAMDRAWIGGYDVTGKNGAWMWSDGHPMTFTDWAKGEPNNAGGQQYCMVMNWSSQHLWDNEYCHRKFSSVCKKTAESAE